MRSVCGCDDIQPRLGGSRFVVEDDHKGFFGINVDKVCRRLERRRLGQHAHAHDFRAFGELIVAREHRELS